MKIKHLAPVYISVYIRIEHLKKNIEALQKNFLANKTELFLFSDAPKKGDEIKVFKMRQYLKTITGFKSVNIVYRRKNSRVYNNQNAQKSLLKKYGKVIIMEEDIVTAPGFLTFMNQSLEIYKDREDILCISGYCPPIDIQKTYKEDVILLDRMYGWSLAIWEAKYKKIKNIKEKELNKLIDLDLKNELIQKGEEDLIYFFKAFSQNLFYGLDVKANYLIFKNKMYSISPAKSLVFNIGLDGSGLHSGKTQLYDTILSNEINFKMNKNIKLNDNVLNIHYEFRRFASYWES